MQQHEIEEMYSKKRVNQMIREFVIQNIETSELSIGVAVLSEYINQETYPSKQRRLNTLKELDLEKFILDVICRIAVYEEPTLLTNVVGSLASLCQQDKIDAIKTMSEVLVVLAEMDFYDLEQEDNTSWVFSSKIELPNDIQQQVLRSMYLPPMIEEPQILESNRDSGYKTIKDSLILGSGNYHDGDITLDVLNLMASVPLKLDVDFIRNHEEPAKDFSADELMEENEFMSEEDANEEIRFRQKMFEHFKAQSTDVYNLLIDNGNKFYLNQKVDKRGRVYAQGYHVSTAGNSYKKAMIELYEEEIVEGI